MLRQKKKWNRLKRKVIRKPKKLRNRPRKRAKSK